MSFKRLGKTVSAPVCLDFHSLRGTLCDGIRMGRTAVLNLNQRRLEEMKHLSNAEIAIIKARIARGDKYSEIAADYRINQGRIADLKFGRIYNDVPAADLSRR
jgi:hypothetical protein